MMISSKCFLKFNRHEVAWLFLKINCDVARLSSRIDCNNVAGPVTRFVSNKVAWMFCKLNFDDITQSSSSFDCNDVTRTTSCKWSWWKSHKNNCNNAHNLAILCIDGCKCQIKLWQTNLTINLWIVSRSWKQGCPGVPATQQNGCLLVFFLML